MDFKNDLQINLDDLHIEWKNHADTRYKYASQISDLDRKVKKAHERLKVTRSQLIRDANKDPEGTCDAKKLTAPLIEAYYRTHPDHKKAKEDLIQAEYDLSMAYNATRAMDDRKFALQDCVKLYLNNYFSTPREERIVGIDESEKSINKLQDEKREETQTAQRGALKPKNNEAEKSKSEKPTRRRRKK